MSQPDLDMFLAGSSLLVTVISAYLITWLAIRFVIRRFNLHVFYPRDVFEYFGLMFASYPDDIDRETAERHFRYILVIQFVVFLLSFFGVAVLLLSFGIPSVFAR